MMLRTRLALAVVVDDASSTVEMCDHGWRCDEPWLRVSIRSCQRERVRVVRVQVGAAETVALVLQICTSAMARTKNHEVTHAEGVSSVVVALLEELEWEGSLEVDARVVVCSLFEVDSLVEAGWRVVVVSGGSSKVEDVIRVDVADNSALEELDGRSVGTSDV